MQAKGEMNMQDSKPLIKSKITNTGWMTLAMGIAIYIQSNTELLEFLTPEWQAGIVGALGVAVIVFRNFFAVKPIVGVLK